MKPECEQGIALFNLSDFYGMDHPDYLDVFVEFNEDLDRVTDLIANAILQFKTSTREQFREMLFLQLGYMGFDADEETFYTRCERWLYWIAGRLSLMLPSGKLEFVDAIEDTEWVNVIYREYLEPPCKETLLIDSTKQPTFRDLIGL